MTSMELIPFHGDQLAYIEFDGLPYTAIKPICERLGVSRQGQQQKLGARPELWGGKNILLPSPGGQQETYCIPISRVAAWLFTITPTKVKPELREALRLYHVEAADVLDRHFRQKRDEDAAEIADLKAALAHCHANLLAALPKWGVIRELEAKGASWPRIARMAKLSWTNAMEEKRAMEKCRIAPAGHWDDGTTRSSLDRIRDLEAKLRLATYQRRTEEVGKRQATAELRSGELDPEADDRTPPERIMDGDMDADRDA